MRGLRSRRLRDGSHQGDFRYSSSRSLAGVRSENQDDWDLARLISSGSSPQSQRDALSARRGHRQASSALARARAAASTASWTARNEFAARLIATAARRSAISARDRSLARIRSALQRPKTVAALIANLSSPPDSRWCSSRSRTSAPAHAPLWRHASSIFAGKASSVARRIHSLRRMAWSWYLKGS
jgi:hypothetical protein